MTLPVCKGRQAQKHKRIEKAILRNKKFKPRKKGQSKKSAAIAIANIVLGCHVKRK